LNFFFVLIIRGLDPRMGNYYYICYLFSSV